MAIHFLCNMFAEFAFWSKGWSNTWQDIKSQPISYIVLIEISIKNALGLENIKLHGISIKIHIFIWKIFWLKEQNRQCKMEISNREGLARCRLISAMDLPVVYYMCIVYAPDHHYFCSLTRALIFFPFSISSNGF